MKYPFFQHFQPKPVITTLSYAVCALVELLKILCPRRRSKAILSKRERFKSTTFFKVLARMECDGVVQKKKRGSHKRSNDGVYSPIKSV